MTNTRLGIAALVVVLLIGFYMFVSPQDRQTVQGGLPAVVNPTGWDKPGICKKLDVMINLAKDKQSIVRCMNRLQGYVCDLPSPLYTDLMEVLDMAPRNDNGIIDDDKLTLLLFRQKCLLFELNIMVP